MAMTHDYLDYLNESIEIAPANSQEELQAAQTIAEVMHRHGMNPAVEEFDAPAWGGVTDWFLMALMFLGILFAGIGVTVLTVIGFVLVAGPTVVFVMKYLGNDLLADFGPSARSQNVVAMHPAEGPLVTKGIRPIVIVAHYDTRHENPVLTSPVGKFIPMAGKLSPILVVAVAVCTLIQILGFLPEPFRRVVWILGILLSLPLLLLGVSATVELFTPSTEGASDNKSGVAAMLGVMDYVRPSGEKSAYPEYEDPTLWAPVEPEPVVDEPAAESIAAAEVAPFVASVTPVEPFVAPTPAPVTEPESAVAAERTPELQFVSEPATEAAPAVDESAPLTEQVSQFETVPAAEQVIEFEPVAEPTAEPLAESEPVAAPAPTAEPVAVQPQQHATAPVVRHGEEVLRSLGMLPEDCEIEYVYPAPAQTTVAASAFDQTAYEQTTVAPVSAPSYVVQPYGQELPPIKEHPFARPETNLPPLYLDAEWEPIDESAEMGPQPHVASEGYVASESNLIDLPSDFTTGRTAQTASIEPLDQASEPAVGETAPLGTVEQPAASVTAADLMATGRFALSNDDSGVSAIPDEADSAGLTNMEDLEATQPSAPVMIERPAAPEDPEWGKTSFRPQGANVARRMSLFDLPNPGEESIDPFATDPRGQAVDAPAPVDTAFQTISAADDEPQEKGGKSFFSKLFGKKKDAEQPEEDWADIANYDNWGDDDWKGGATTRSDLRLVDGEEGSEDLNGAEAVPSEEDLVDAVLSMSDDELLCHDIWFVALGAGSLGNAGMKAFLSQHRRQCRGAFVVNLDSIGSGELTMLTREGVLNTRRADRRMVRLLGRVASDLHIPVAQATHEWGVTDATPAMRSSMRAVTITGLDESGLKSLSGSPADVIEHVNPAQTAQVAQMVTEMIRRS